MRASKILRYRLGRRSRAQQQIEINRAPSKIYPVAWGTSCATGCGFVLAHGFDEDQIYIFDFLWAVLIASSSA